VVSQAAANFYLLPELYNAVASDGPIGNYTGSIPMVGYGAGAYLMTMMDRSGLVEPNDCGDGMGVKLPVITCSGTGSGTGSSGSPSGGGGSSNSGSGAGGGGNADLPPYGTGACLCRADGAGGRHPAALLLLGAVPLLLALRRTRRRG
jgi:hypothetical protein